MGPLLPVQVRSSPPAARWIGAAVLAGSLAALGAALLQRRTKQPAGRATAPAAALRRSTALLAGSVFADSLVEHYRGGFENSAMLTPVAISAAVIGVGASGAGGRGADLVHWTAFGAGAAGTGFHVYNLARRIGGIGWLNLFYGAPLGAPAALSLAGLLGLAAERTGDSGSSRGLGALLAAGIIGTSSEALLLHFRGAFHNPAMWAPVLVPPLAAAGLVAVTVFDDRRADPAARTLLLLTAAAGIAGVGFHIYGVGRHMGGWRNWSQNLFDGPPIPAPPAFTALALAGLAALEIGTAADD